MTIEERTARAVLAEAAVLAGLALVGAGTTLGLGRQWARLPVVRRASWLR